MKIPLIILLLFVSISLILISCNQQTETYTTNPLISENNTPFNVPLFEKIMAKHYIPAFEKGIEEGRMDIEQIVSNNENPTFANTVEAYDRASKLLFKAMMVFTAQASANTDDSLMAIQMKISPMFAGFMDEVLLNGDFFKG